MELYSTAMPHAIQTALVWQDVAEWGDGWWRSLAQPKLGVGPGAGPIFIRRETLNPASTCLGWYTDSPCGRTQVPSRERPS